MHFQGFIELLGAADDGVGASPPGGQSHLGTPRKHGIWSLTSPIQPQARRSKHAMLGSRMKAFAEPVLPGMRLRMVGMDMKAKQKAMSHIMAKS